MRLHPEVLLEPDWSVSLVEWAQRRGRGGAGTGVRTLLHACQQRLARERAAREGTWAADLPVVGATITEHLAAHAEAVRAAWFADLPRITVTWSRNPPRRRLSHLRFGCFRRRERCISISPRLARPWIASVFLNHVLHHEYCHLRQAEQPTARREGVHSPRFRSWERTFPGYADALRWEHLALPWLLDDDPPPWYRPSGSHA